MQIINEKEKKMTIWATNAEKYHNSIVYRSNGILLVKHQLEITNFLFVESCVDLHGWVCIDITTMFILISEWL